MTWFRPGLYGRERANFESRFEKMPGGQLAIVRYGAQHNTLNERVYNDPDTDNAKVVWATEMSPEDNLELIRCHANRKCWLAEPGTIPARLSPYPVRAWRRLQFTELEH